MNLFHIITAIVTLTALFSYINHRYLNFQPSIGVMLIAMAVSLVLAMLSLLGLGIRPVAVDFLKHIKFDDALMQWMLGFLLFAGAMTVDLDELRRQKGLVAVLAVVGTIVSAFLVAGLMALLFAAAGFHVPFIDCLLLGALISPTDPVAVLSLVRGMNAPPHIETVIAGESLFNDGVGVVLFLTLEQLNHAGSVSILGVTGLFIRESMGGAILGLICGSAIYLLLRLALEIQLEVLLTLSLVMGTVSLAGVLGVSGPIAVVVAGLLIGNHGRIFPMAREISRNLAEFWELIDQLLNAVLFVLMGLEILAMPFLLQYLMPALLAIPIILLARWASVAGTLCLPGLRGSLGQRGIISILTWGGLRGGLAIAMALSMGDSENGQLILAVTYGVVAFSILIQGTTMRWLVQRVLQTPAIHQPVVSTMEPGGRL